MRATMGAVLLDPKIVSWPVITSFQQIFSPFPTTFGEIRPKFGHEFFLPPFSLAPFKLSGQNFSYLATQGIGQQSPDF
jgi:hypothetical protein